MHAKTGYPYDCWLSPLFCAFFPPKKRLESMTDVSPSKVHAKLKLPSLTVIVSKLPSFYLKQVN